MLIHFIPCSAIIIVQKFIFLLKEIFEFNMSGAAVPVIRDIYNKLFMSLLWLNQQVYWFWCIAGHRQGDELNATLFALFIDEIKQRRPTTPSSQTTVRSPQRSVLSCRWEFRRSYTYMYKHTGRDFLQLSMYTARWKLFPTRFRIL